MLCMWCGIILTELVDVCLLVSFKANFPEDGHNRRTKHVGGYAVYNTLNLHICIGTCWSVCHDESSVHSHE
jgi:hypothetical protein